VFCIRVAPAFNAPNNNPASTTPAGWLRPTKPTAIAVNP
jgi:hypothetical protein